MSTCYRCLGILFLIGVFAGAPAMGQLQAKKTWKYDATTKTYTITVDMTYSCGCFKPGKCPQAQIAWTAIAVEYDWSAWDEDDDLGFGGGAFKCNKVQKCLADATKVLCTGSGRTKIVTVTGSDWGDDVGVKVIVGKTNIEIDDPISVPLFDADFHGFFSGMGMFSGNTILAATGEDIAAMSRGYDAITELLSGEALLYMTMIDPNLPPAALLSPETVYAIEPTGRFRDSEIFKCPNDVGDVLLEAINVESTPEPDAGPATEELYVVFISSDNEIYYSAAGLEGLPDRTLFHVFDPSVNLDGIAIQDEGVRGVWDAGDTMLYTIFGSAAIYTFSFGDAVPGFLTFAGKTFDGSTSATFSGFLDDGSTWSATLDDISSLSVSGRTEPLFDTPDNQFVPTCSAPPEICGDPDTFYPIADLNYDCYVNILDFVLMAQEWLNCTDPALPLDCG